MSVMQEPYTIQEMAIASGLSEHTLRYYERFGLLAPERDASSGHRRYAQRDLQWVEFLKRLRATAMPLAQIKRYADLLRQGDATIAERQRLLEEHRLLIAASLREAQQHLDAITLKIALYKQLHAPPASAELVELYAKENA
ncbi:MAG TPA: MerR family transcriptional regulator [Herpetosiphonaceae bacterium]|nr:MerR family transcriptional regulator [Herpetosiphonaceae bacterium]